MSISSEQQFQFDNVEKPIEQASGLPNSSYTDKAISKIERDNVLANTWVCLGFTSQLTESRYVIPTTLSGLPLVMVRGAGESIKVFHNVCRHRGHVLVQQEGPVKGAIRCPYHCWTYNFAGKLLNTPHVGGDNIHQVAGFDKANYGLWEVRSHVWQGMVFVNLSGDAPDFSDYIAPLNQRWQQFLGDSGLAQYQLADRYSDLYLKVKSNWKLAVENYCEAYHLPWIHPDLNSYSKLSDHYNIHEDDIYAGQGTTVYQYAQRVDANLPEISAWPKDRQSYAEYIAFFPNLLMGIHIDHMFALIILPESNDTTHEIGRIFYVGEEGANDRYRHIHESYQATWRKVFSEDIGVVEGMQKGRDSTAFDGGVFTAVQDVPTHTFHRWMAKRMKSVFAANS